MEVPQKVSNLLQLMLLQSYDKMVMELYLYLSIIILSMLAILSNCTALVQESMVASKQQRKSSCPKGEETAETRGKRKGWCMSASVWEGGEKGKGRVYGEGKRVNGGRR